MLAISFAERAAVRMRLQRSTAPFAVALFVLVPQLISTTPLSAAAPALAIQETPQEKPDSARADTIPLKPILLDPINVTATRNPQGTFETAAPVLVVDTLELRERRPNNAAEVMLDQPSVDIVGVGANQQRPQIRGQRGQRVLLLEDGLRINNSRRDADFGEIPALADISTAERIEVVRGPASVLYGSDAIGGVVNILGEEAPPYAAGDMFRGNLSLSWRDQGEQIWPSGNVFGRSGHFGYGVSASYKNTKEFDAPSGTFGDVEFGDDVTVNDTGLEDESYGLYLDYAFDARQKIMAKADFYRAKNAGFGYVSPQDLNADDGTVVRLRYPDQKVDRFALTYRGVELNTPIFDRAQVSATYSDNERDFTQDINVPFFAGPGTDLLIALENYTDIETFGTRAEASKEIGRHLLTYGGEYYREDAFNRDYNQTTVSFGGPPMSREDSTTKTPNTVYEKAGAFAQVDLQLVERVGVIVGGRYQRDKATPKPTENRPGPLPASVDNDQFVGAINLLVEALPNLHLVGNVGTAFRSPNVTELFFEGVTPDGDNYLVPNPGLEPETSLNFDLGFKYRRSNVVVEALYFQTELRDEIVVAAIPDSTVIDNGRPLQAYSYFNLPKSRVNGVELLAEWQPVAGFTIGATYTYLDGKDLTEDADPDGPKPTSGTYSNRVTAELGYRHPDGRFWAAYQIRHNGEQDNAGFESGGTDVDRGCGPYDPDNGWLGNDELCRIPSFTVMNIRGGVRLFTHGALTHNLMLGVENLANELYAEFANSSFFRPNPKRTFVISWVTSF